MDYLVFLIYLAACCSAAATELCFLLGIGINKNKQVDFFFGRTRIRCRQIWTGILSLI